LFGLAHSPFSLNFAFGFKGFLGSASSFYKREKYFGNKNLIGNVV
jgi:hypothetical protein